MLRRGDMFARFSYRGSLVAARGSSPRQNTTYVDFLPPLDAPAVKNVGSCRIGAMAASTGGTRTTLVRLGGAGFSVLYAVLIAWLYASQPQTVAEVTGGLTATIGAYRVDQQAYDDGLAFFRKDQFEEARAA